MTSSKSSNNITGDKLISKQGDRLSKANYSEGYDKIFGKKKPKPKKEVKNESTP